MSLEFCNNCGHDWDFHGYDVSYYPVCPDPREFRTRGTSPNIDGVDEDE